MNKQRMIKMLTAAKEAVAEAELDTFIVTDPRFDAPTPPMTEGTQNLIGQLILASAIEESGSSIGMSLDKLDGLTLEISEIARAIGNHS